MGSPAVQSGAQPTGLSNMTQPIPHVNSPGVGRVSQLAMSTMSDLLGKPNTPGGGGGMTMMPSQLGPPSNPHMIASQAGMMGQPTGMPLQQQQLQQQQQQQQQLQQQQQQQQQQLQQQQQPGGFMPANNNLVMMNPAGQQAMDTSILPQQPPPQQQIPPGAMTTTIPMMPSQQPMASEVPQQRRIIWTGQSFNLSFKCPTQINSIMSGFRVFKV